MNGAELFVKCLEQENVKYIFGVPGEENEDLLFAIEHSNISFIPVRHEQGGAFMADVWGRVTGQAGVCLATLGPGATNLVTGVADAFLDKSPVVALTGQGGLLRLHHESHQYIDVVDMMKSITKWSSAVTDVKVIPEIVRKAFKIATSEKPGATHIELAEDVAGHTVEKKLIPLQDSHPRLSAPDKKSFQKALELINHSKKLLIIAGNGAIRNRASEALTSFSEAYNIPVASTFMGKGAISDKSPQSLGAMGLGFKDYVIEAAEAADLILCIGYDIAEYDPEGWNKNNDKTIIHLDFSPAEVFTHYIPEVELICDLATCIRSFHQEMKREAFKNWYTEIRQRIHASISHYNLKDDAPEFQTPGVLSIIREELSDDGLLISDVGSHKMWIARNYQTYCPNGCIISNGLASMGIALPGGIAASLADPDRQVVAVMGDGGALMNIQELETAKRLGVSCTFIILNDNQYGLIKWKQEMSEGKSFGTEIGNPDFVKLAESFGIDGYKPTTVENLRKTFNKVFNNKSLSLIEIPISTDVNNELIEELKNYYN